MKDIGAQTLSSLRSGQSATIKKIGSQITGPQRRRLLDLGIVPGVKIRHHIDGPSGEPRAFEVLNSVIALRKEQTDHIQIKAEEEE